MRYLQLKHFSIVSLIIIFSFMGDLYTYFKSVPVNAVFMTTDKIGNCYIVSENNQLTKYNNLGVLEANYSNKSLGKLKSVDATNPLKILLFYADFNQIITLDNKLSLGSQLPLGDLNILQPILICASANEGIWIFDQQDFQLKRLDFNLKIIQESGNIPQITGLTLQPTQLLESNGYLYLNNPANGILVFDLFGSYYKTIPITGVSSIQVIGDELLYFNGKQLNGFNLKTLIERNVQLPATADSTTLNVRIEQQKLYLAKKQQLNMYTF